MALFTSNRIRLSGASRIAVSLFLLFVLAVSPLAGAPAAGTLIGPFFTNDPEGLAIIPAPHANKTVAYNVSIGWVAAGRYQHGYRALARPQWHLQAMRWGRSNGTSRMYWLISKNNVLHVHWQRVKGTTTAVASLSVEHPVQVVLECLPTWHRYGALYRAKANEITGSPASAKSEAGFCLLTNRPADAAVVASHAKAFSQAVLHGGSAPASRAAAARYAGLIFNLTPKHPLYFLVRVGSAQVHNARTLASVPQILSSGWAAYISGRPHASGDWGDFISPISMAANSGVVYQPDLSNITATVARQWCLPKGCVLFAWDSFFNSTLLSLNDGGVGPWYARRQLAGVLHFQMNNGMICNFANWDRKYSQYDKLNPHYSPDRSEPPVSAMCVWQAYQRWPSKSLLEACYKPLVRYHHWWFAINPKTHLPNRDGNHDGLLEYGSSTGNWQSARFESGADDSPMYVRGKVKLIPPADTFDLNDIGLNSLWAADAMYLSRIAAALGHKNAAAHYAAECQTMSQRINAQLWSHKLGMYCNRYWSPGAGHHLFSRRWGPRNFYPMIVGVPDAARAQRMLAVLLNKKYFWGKWVLPTISRNNPAYQHQEYWRGDIWGPTNYLAFQGLLNYAPTSVLHAYARKSVKLFMRNWDTTGVWSENYLATTGIAARDPHYSWGALLPMIGLQAICNVMPDNKVRLDGTWHLHAKLYNIPVLGYQYTIVVKPGLTQMLRHGHVVASAANKVAILSLPQRPIP